MSSPGPSPRMSSQGPSPRMSSQGPSPRMSSQGPSPRMSSESDSSSVCVCVYRSVRLVVWPAAGQRGDVPWKLCGEDLDLLSGVKGHCPAVPVGVRGYKNFPHIS